MKSDILRADFHTAEPRRHIGWLLDITRSLTRSKYDRSNAQALLCDLRSVQYRLDTEKRKAIEEKFQCSSWHRSTRHEASIARGLL